MQQPGGISQEHRGCRGCAGCCRDSRRTRPHRWARRRCRGRSESGPPITPKGFWIFKKKFCTQCEQQLDKSWDACPFCAQMAQQAAVAPAKLQALKTLAFVIDSAGSQAVQLLGWLVPLQGANRGELFALQPKEHHRQRW